MGAEPEAFAPSVHLTMSASPSLAARRGQEQVLGNGRLVATAKPGVSLVPSGRTELGGGGQGPRACGREPGCRWTPSW